MSGYVDHNYYETFISVADDCPVRLAESPPARAGKPTAAQIHLQLTRDEPYRYTQEQVLFRAHLNAKGLDPDEHPEHGQIWHEFFSKGQPCLRSSALGKRYGWGLHFDEQGRVAAVALGSDEYRQHARNDELRQVKAMRSSRK